MALKLIINIAKKMPGPLEFSSVQASCSIEGELIAGQDPLAEAAKLYAQAERAVDQQLHIQATPAAAPAPITSAQAPTQPPAPAPTPALATTAVAASPRRASQPYRNANRKAPAPATDSQLRYIDRLLTETRTDLNAVLQEYQVGSLRDLSCKDAAGLIDALKQGVPS